MKEMMFWILYLSSITIIIYKVLKSFSYFNAKFKKGNTDELYKELSIVQVIENLGAEVESNIKNNLKKLNNSHFVFIVEKDKKDSKEFLENTMKNCENQKIDILETDKNLTINYKMEEALKKSKTFTLVLNENIKIQGDIGEILAELKGKEFIVNGLSYEMKEGSFLTGLKGAFFNWHSFFGNLSLAEIGRVKRINSDFFASRTKTLLEYKIFEQLEDDYIDEVEFAKITIDKGVDIFQSRVIGENNSVVKNRSELFDYIGKEVEVFLTLTRDATDLRVYFLTIIPIILTSLTFFYSMFMGINYVILVIVSLFLKATDTYVIRKLMVEKTVGKGEIIREIFLDIFGIVFIFFRKSR